MGIPTIILTDGTQEFISISDDETVVVPDNVSVTNAHTKIFSTAQKKTVSLGLPDGVERGQMKMITYCQQDSLDVTIDIVPKRFYNGVKIILSRKGDQIHLVWSGFTWILSSSLNLIDPEFGPDVVGR